MTNSGAPLRRSTPAVPRSPKRSLSVKTFHGQQVWEGVVHVFDVEGHPTATRAYAWSSPVDGINKRRFFAVLHLGVIRSPQDAVRAAIMAEPHDRG